MLCVTWYDSATSGHYSNYYVINFIINWRWLYFFDGKSIIILEMFITKNNSMEKRKIFTKLNTLVFFSLLLTSCLRYDYYLIEGLFSCDEMPLAFYQDIQLENFSLHLTKNFTYQQTSDSMENILSVPDSGAYYDAEISIKFDSQEAAKTVDFLFLGPNTTEPNSFKIIIDLSDSGISFPSPYSSLIAVLVAGKTSYEEKNDKRSTCFTLRAFGSAEEIHEEITYYNVASLNDFVMHAFTIQLQ